MAEQRIKHSTLLEASGVGGNREPSDKIIHLRLSSYEQVDETREPRHTDVILLQYTSLAPKLYFLASLTYTLL